MRQHTPRSIATSFILVFLILGYGLTRDAAAVRYTPPPLGAVILNQVLDGPTAVALRLPRMGRYYLELYLEPRASDVDITLAAPLPITLELSISRRDRILVSERKNVVFAPGERAKTVLWLEAPTRVPERTNLELKVQANGTLAPAQQLRLMVMRKLEVGPFLFSR